MTQDDQLLKFFEIKDLLIINNALNEVCNGFHVHNFEQKIGVSPGYANQLLDKIGHIYDDMNKLQYSGENSDHDALSINDLIIMKNALNEVLKEIEDWEFETRMGVSRDESLQFICKITKLIEDHKKTEH